MTIAVSIEAIEETLTAARHEANEGTRLLLSRAQAIGILDEDITSRDLQVIPAERYRVPAARA